MVSQSVDDMTYNMHVGYTSLSKRDWWMNRDVLWLVLQVKTEPLCAILNERIVNQSKKNVSWCKIAKNLSFTIYSTYEKIQGRWGNFNV